MFLARLVGISLAICLFASGAVFAQETGEARSGSTRTTPGAAILNGGALGVMLAMLQSVEVEIPGFGPRWIPARTLTVNLDTSAGVARAQTLLNATGYDAGAADGALSPRTRAAVAAFQADLANRPTGTLTKDEFAALVVLEDLLTDDPPADRGRALRALQAFSEVNPDVVAQAEQRNRRPPRQAAARAPARPKPSAPDAIAPPDAPTMMAASAPAFDAGPVATRVFSTAADYPPSQFRGYGIIAFTSLATAADHARYAMICEAYLSALDHTSRVSAPVDQQFVTVWPMRTKALVNTLNMQRATPAIFGAMCDAALEDYDRDLAKEALRNARLAGVNTSGIGPFLFGWVPGRGFGEEDTLVIDVNLSGVDSHVAAQTMFRHWIEYIQSNRDLADPRFSWADYIRGIAMQFDMLGAKINVTGG